MSVHVRRSRILLTALMIFGACLLTAPGAAPTVSALPTSLTFNWQMGAAIPASQVVSLKITAGTPAYTATASVATPWLIATSSAATLPAALTVWVNPSTLTPGTYVSTVTVTAAGAAGPITIPITLNVTLPPGSAVVAPTTLALASPGSLTGTFAITAGLAPTTFTVVSGATWLTVSANAGAVLPNETQTLTVTANPAALNPQVAAYPGKLTVTTTANGVATTQTVTVNLTVNAQTPTVASVWPSQIPVGSPNTTLTIQGVNFYSGTTVTATGSATPLKLTLVSSTVLLAVLPAAQVAAVGAVNLTVTNPAPGGAAAPYGISVGNAPSIAAITNAASYSLGAVSPGEMIAIFGQNLGPTPAVDFTVAGGFVPTSAGGVSVTIDGQPAPILYASASQVTVQVPYTAQLGTAALGTARTVVLTYGLAAPVSTTTDIVAAAPGVFTMNASGVGQAIVLNIDPVTFAYSVNSAANPAKIGNAVTFFLTGEGDYASATYATETGFIVPATPPVATGVYPELAPLPTVTIGGTAATSVTYAGPIPTCMLGLLQVNAVVPVGATTGNAVPLLVNIGAGQTQIGLTMAVAP